MEDRLPPTSDAVWEELPRIVEPIFGIDERPDSWWETLLYGWQHTLVDISPFVLPLAVAAAIGMSPDEEASLINFGLFSMGVATLSQTTIGNRLPPATSGRWWSRWATTRPPARSPESATRCVT